MFLNNSISRQVSIEKIDSKLNCTNPYADLIPATEWSILAALALFLIRYIVKINSKLLEEVCEDKQD